MAVVKAPAAHTPRTSKRFFARCIPALPFAFSTKDPVPALALAPLPLSQPVKLLDGESKFA
jgi:hypothetical protein